MADQDERILRAGIPYSVTMDAVDGELTTVEIGTVRPPSDDYVFVVESIGVRINVEAATVWELEILSPHSDTVLFFDAPANDAGAALVGLFDKVTSSAGTTGITYFGIIDNIPKTVASYYTKTTGSTTDSTMGAGAWGVRVGANTLDDGTDNIPTVITFKGQLYKVDKVKLDPTPYVVTNYY
jgi:hypothetical protein